MVGSTEYQYCILKSCMHGHALNTLPDSSFKFQGSLLVLKS